MSERKLFKTTLLGVTVLGTILLTACGGEKADYFELSAGESGVYITDDEVIYQLCEDFSEDYYSKKELKKQIQAEVDAFNDSNDASGKKAMKMETFDVSGDEANVVLTFATTDDFINYVNNYEQPVEEFVMYYGTYSDADSEVYGTYSELVEASKAVADKKESSEDSEDESVISVSDDSKVLILNKAVKIKTDSKINVVSSNVTVEDDVATTTSDMSYIFY